MPNRMSPKPRKGKIAQLSIGYTILYRFVRRKEYHDYTGCSCCEFDKYGRDGLTAERVAVQRRAVEIGTAVGTIPRSKIAPISWRNARPLQRRVRRPRRRRATWHPHLPTTPSWYHAGITGVRSEARAAQDHARHNGPRSGITRIWYHLASHVPPAQRALVPHTAQRARSTTSLCTTPAQRAPSRRSQHDEPSGIAIRRIQTKKRKRLPCHGCRTCCRLAAPPPIARNDI